MYDDYDAENDTFSQTNVLGQIGELVVVVVGEDVKQMVVPTVKMLPLSNGKKGCQKGGANGKTIPKTFVRCEEPSCQFSMKQEDKVSAMRV